MYLNDEMEKKLKIIGYAKLQFLTRKTVDHLFSDLYEYLESQERFEECAILKKKEENYRKLIKEKSKVTI